MENRWDIPFSADDRVKHSDFDQWEKRFQIKITEFDTGGAEIAAIDLRPLVLAHNRALHGSGQVWPETKEEREQRQERCRQSSCRRAKRKVRHLVRQLSELHMFTLTTRAVISDIEEFKRRFDLFRRAVKAQAKRYARNFDYIAVPELQERGAWHLHMACESRALKGLMIRVWQRLNPEGAYVHHRANRGGKRPQKALAAYLSKYVSKTFDNDKEKGAKKYWCSRTLIRPRVSTYLMPPGTTIEQVVRHVLSWGAFAYADKKNWDTWLSENAGIFWYSTD